MGGLFSAIKTWIAGDVLTAADLNAEFQNVITNLYPAKIDDESSDVTAMRAVKDPYAGSTEVLPTSLQQEIQELRYMIKAITGKDQWYKPAEAALVPTGGMVAWTTNTAPTGFLLCDGTSYVRGDYTALFAVIGTTFGTTDGSHFSVPDMRGRFPLGKDNMGGASANRVTSAQADTLGGAENDQSHTHTTGDVTLTAAQSGLPAHTHDLTNRVSSSQYPDGVVVGVNAPANPVIATGAVTGGAANASAAHNHGATGSGLHVGPYLTLNWIIKT